MANVFTADPNCVALWKFESGALTTDSIGTNTLTDNNTVGTETSDYKEGSACADLELGNSEYFSIADADLDSGFPLKNGDTTKKISICGWFKAESFISAPGNGIVSKWYSSTDKTILFRVYGGDFQFYIGYGDGSTSEQLYSGGSPVTGRWYHFGLTFQDSDKSWKLVIWDDTAGSKVVDTSGTATNNINLTSYPFGIGVSWFDDPDPGALWDGLIDEVVVFKDILTTDEIDLIRAGTYEPVNVQTTTATLTITPNAATVYAPTVIAASTVSLTISTGTAVVYPPDIAVECTTASLTITANKANVPAIIATTTAALTAATGKANIPYDIDATTQALTIATGSATVWDGAAWAAWIAANGDKLTYLYYCTLTGTDDGETDLTLPMSSFQARRKDGDPTFLSIVTPYSSTRQTGIAARTNGTIQVSLAYILEGVEQYREVIVQADYEEMRIDRGGRSQSITLTGHKTESFTPKTIELQNVIYESDDDGDLRYRCSAVALYLNPGDTATYESNSFTVGQITYAVSVDGASVDVMESET